MKQLQHILFVTEPDVTLHLHNGAAEAALADKNIVRFPLHTLEGIVSFAYKPATAELMEACVKNNISFNVMTPGGKFRYRVEGGTHGNTSLRMLQYSMHSTTQPLELARLMIAAKIRNQAQLLRRYTSNHPEDTSYFVDTISDLNNLSNGILAVGEVNALRGLEAVAAKKYFSVYGKMIRTESAELQFVHRSKHPPLDRCNALLSFAYSILTLQCTAALESVGLDPSLGVLHTVRSGRPSLSLDLVEELRPVMADRTVLTLINRSQVNPDMITQIDEENWHLTADGLKTFFKEWSAMRGREVYCPSCGEKIPLGLVPYAQAQCLARYVRGDSERYIPFLWEA